MADTELRPARKHDFVHWRVKFLLAVLLIAAFTLTPAARASNQWFVSTSGSPSGDGSSTNPWDLNTALNQPAVVHPGDTIWVRGGVYRAPSSNGYSTLLTGTAANPIIVRNYNNERAIIDGITDEFALAVRGSYSWFWGLEITDSTTNRTPSSCDAILGYEPHPSAFGVGVYGPSNKFINLIVHDTAQGFSAYDESPDTEFTGNLSYYNGNLPYPSCPGGDRNHGHGMYLQNVTGLKTVNDNIIGDNADEGIQMYGGGGANVQGFRLNGNAFYNSSSWPDQNFQFNVLIAGGAVRRDIQFNNNFSYFTPSRNFGVVSFGEYTDGQDMTVTNNTFVGGYTAVAVIDQAGPFTFTGNTVYTTPSSVKEVDLEPDVANGQTIASYTWDHNSYFGLNNFLYLQNRNFTSWQGTTGFDTHSTFTAGTPTGPAVSVRPNAWEPKRANIIIYNWDLSSAVNVDLSSVLAQNDAYVVLDAQNYYGPPVAQGTYTGSTVSIPMMGLAKAQPHGFDPPAHTAPLFGTFIVMPAASAPVPVSVTVTPPNTVLKQSETQQFTATVQNTSDLRVTWSITPAVGTITSNGFYTAPPVMNAAQTITVTATSVADPSRSGSMTLSLKPPIAVSVGPANSILGPSQTKQFLATVTSTDNTAVTWAISPGIGSIASDGSYTAPSAISGPQTITITATSVADPTKFGSVTTTIQPVAVTIAPANVTLYVGESQQFIPTVTGADNTAVTWTSNPPGVGTLSPTGLYTAPNPLSGASSVTVTATSVSDNSKSATASVTLSLPISPTFLQPIPDVTALSGQAVTLNVQATGGGLSYQWESQPPGGSSFSTIPGATSSSYTTAPVTLADSGTQFHCIITNSVGTATSNASHLIVILGVNYVSAATLGTMRNNFTGWVGANLTIGPNQMTVTSLGRMFAPGNTGSHIVKLVTAAGVDVPGGSVAVPMIGGTPGTFMYNNLPSLVNLSPNTTYYLLSQETSGGDQWYDLDTSVQTSGVATVIGPAYGTPYAAFTGSNHMYGPLDLRYSAYLSVSPAGTILYGGQSRQFTVTITGTSNNDVTWSLNPAVGTISSSGLYIAPATITTPQAVSVTATSVADPSRSATAIVTLNPPIAVFVSPSAISMTHGQIQQFTATVLNTPNPGVEWSVIPPVGTISTSGLYTAPSSITSPQSITVLAISMADGTTDGSTTVTLTPPVPVTVTPGSTSLGVSQTQQFTANQQVTWSLSPSVGSISSSGLYTAPATISPSGQTVTVTATSNADGTQHFNSTITLVPPAPASISQQPQNQAVLAGQPATFTVVAAGTQISYQWQSMPAGAGSFSPIAGATNSSYTLASPAVTDHGTQYRCVVTNSVSSVTSSAATLSVVPAGVNFVQSVTIGTSRNDFSGWVGMKITVGSTPISIGALGRYYLSGNHGNHTMKIVDAATGVDIPNASTTVNVALGSAPGTFVYAPLTSNVTLTPNHSYYIVSIEGQFGDSWYDLNTHVQTSSVATVNGAVYGAPFVAASNGNSTYGPVDFLYVVPVTVTMTPAAVQLNVSQSQQFTTTVVGTGNTAVTWTMNPSAGTLTSSGLYTAPGTISTTQTVTVTATSVADPTQSASSTVTLQPVSVSMTPGSASLFGAQTQQFNPTVTGTSNTGLTWSINPAGAGSISATGLYTAPASIAAAQSVTVSATSVVDNAKSASGTVTLQPPPPPTLTSQPQNASVLTGQAAIFSVSATGALGYQWQSQAPGAGSFSNIAGATSSTYTTPPATAGNDGTQFRCVVSNAAGSVNSSAVIMSVIAGTPFVTSIPAVGTIRHDYNGWIGASINVGSTPVTVSALGRLFQAGNSQTHTMKVVTTSGTDLAGSTVSVNMAGGTPGAFVYGVLPTAITLNANTTYYIVTQETVNGDLWYDYTGTTVQTTNVAAAAGAVYGTPYVALSSPNHMFVPVSFLYVSVATVAVSVNPTTASLSASQTQQFTATVTGDPNTSVTWSLNPNVGSISGAGLYTAPSSVASTQTITVTATSVADSTKSASATVTLTPVSVSIAPTTSSLGASQTQQFTPTVTGSSNTTVTWTISPNGIGSISAAGLYAAPSSIASLQTVTVTATSAADNTKFGTAAITLNPPAAPAITQQPVAASTFVGQTASFGVTATGPSLTYQWQSMPSGGSFADIGGATSSSYTTPVLTAGDSGTQFRVVVTNGQGSVTSSAATLTVLASGTGFVTASTPGSLRNDFTGWVGMKVTVGSAAIAVSSIGRTVVLNNSHAHTLKIVDATSGNDLAVTNINTSGATAGTILYGALAAPVTLNANSSYYVLSHENAGSSEDQWYELNSLVQTTTAAVVNGPAYGIPFTLVGGMAGHTYAILDFKYAPAGPAAVAVSLTPTTASLNGGQTQQFTATVTGDPNTSVTWSMNPNVGSLSSTGFYTAPASVTSTQLVTITATSVADNTKSASATVTLAPVSVSLAPASSSLSGGQTQQFTPTVNGTSNTSVTWTINPSSVGTISASGFYTAPASIASSQTVTVTATSVADNTKSASTSVTLVPVAVSVTPTTSSLSGGQTQQFNPTVTGSANTTVNWTLNAGGAGSISASGFYSAPASIGSIQTVTVTATSAADNTKFATATITLNPPAVPVITQQPQNATVNTGITATFSVTATGALSYQWQSQSAGAGSFTPISGATASSYTTPATALTDGGTQFRCVVANSQGSVTSNAATLSVTPAPPPSAKNFVLSTTLGTLRNDFTGWVGMSVTIGSSPLTIDQLGRMFAPGNAGSHIVKLVDAASGADVAGGTVSISMAGGTSGTFVYGSLAAPVILSPGATYYILSQESTGADKWYDYNTTAATNWEATLTASVYGTGSSYASIGNSAGHMYVPLDFKYESPVAAFVSSFTLGTQRNNFTGWVGMGFTVGSSNLTVSGLGRFVSAGDSFNHIVKLVDAATGLDVPGGTVTVNNAGATSGTFAYTTLSSQVILNANAAYFLVSQETAGGDHWYDWDTKVQTPPVGTVTRAVYGSGSSFTVVQTSAGHSYVPLNLQFQ